MQAGEWQQVGDEPVQVGLNLVYTFGSMRMQVGINVAQLQMPNQEEVSALVFTGSCRDNVTADETEQQVAQLFAAINNCEVNLKSY
jgi:hypothetical protein